MAIASKHNNRKLGSIIGGLVMFCLVATFATEVLGQGAFRPSAAAPPNWGQGDFRPPSVRFAKSIQDQVEGNLSPVAPPFQANDPPPAFFPKGNDPLPMLEQQTVIGPVPSIPDLRDPSFAPNEPPAFVSDSEFQVREPVVTPNESGQVTPLPESNKSFCPPQSFNQYPTQGSAFPALPSHQNAPVWNDGFRRSTPTIRGMPRDDHGQQFDFENKKKEYPPFSEILATGRYFGSAELLYVRPQFLNNTAITAESAGSGTSEAFDFGYEAASRYRLGFESKYGPGLELSYTQFDHQSRQSTFTDDGTFTGQTSVWMLGPSRWSRLSTGGLGDVLTAEHGLEVHDFGALVFKDWQLPITRMGGGIGMRYVSIHQDLSANVTDAGGAVTGTINSNHDFRGIGPQLAFNYYRPVGHTKLEAIGGLSASILFGNQDQFVQNTATGDLSQIGADEFMMIVDVVAGLQYVHHYADNRSFYARLTMISQGWLGGGTAILPQDDFGLRGFGFGIGFNR